MLRWLRKISLPISRELTPSERDAFDTIYGTEAWRALERDFENRRSDLNEELLGIWYTVKADPDSMHAACIASVSLVSRMRELEDKLQAYRDRYEAKEPAKVISAPKTIDQML